MRNIRLTIQYDGSGYSGWQFQKNAISIQEIIERALRGILSEKVRVIGASRTDAGVHAEGQVANFRTSSPLDPESIKKALNSALPDDIVISDSTEADSDFHAQFCAKSKLYRYTIINSAIVSPFMRNYAVKIPSKLNVPKMRKAARLIIGTRDVRCFQSSGSTRVSTKRTVKKIAIARKGRFITIDIEADGFLYTMARSIAGTLIEVGRGKIAPEIIKKILSRRDRTLAGPTVPAHGLCLVKVIY